MEQRDFLEKEAIRTPEKELEVRAVFAENAALKEENAAPAGTKKAPAKKSVEKSAAVSIDAEVDE